MSFPKWLYADDISTTRHFLIHTSHPRFLAEIVEEDDDEAALAPLTLVLSGGDALANFMWFDPPPADLEPLRASADHFIRDYTEATDLMTEDQ